MNKNKWDAGFALAEAHLLMAAVVQFSCEAEPLLALVEYQQRECMA